MRKFILAVCSVFLLTGLTGCRSAYDKTGKTQETNKEYQVVLENRTADWLSADGYVIAHAGGGIVEKQEDGTDKLFSYTNSLEALQGSIEKGHELIEMDFMMTSDNELAGTHEWPEGMEKPSSSKWLEYRIEDRYTPLLFRDVAKILKENPEIYLILDIKGSYEAEDVRACYARICEQAWEIGGQQLTDRLVPQIYTEEMYDILMDIYPWPSIIYTLYYQYKQDTLSEEDVLRFISEKDAIHVVTMPKRKVYADFSARIHEAGKLVFTHTVNKKKDAQGFVDQGIDGIYSDKMSQESFQKISDTAGNET